MLSHRGRVLGLIGLLAALAAGIGADDTPSVNDDDLRRLDELRGQPAAYERMRQDLAAFYQLSPQRREQIRQLHQAIQKQDVAARLDLLEGLERYADWRDHLSDDERSQIDRAPGKTARLAVIVRLREEQWIRTLPLRQREELVKLTGQERIARIKQIRAELTWRGPTRFAEYPEDVRQFFDRYVRDRLTSQELEQLRQAENHGPTLGHLLVDLAEEYPYLPGLPSHDRGPVRAEQLPLFSGMQYAAFFIESRQRHLILEKINTSRRLAPYAAMRNLVDYFDQFKNGDMPGHRLLMAHGKWPEYARELTRIVQRDPRFKGVVVMPLGACRPNDFATVTQSFIHKDLIKQITEAEHRKLRFVEGKWPQYPETLLALAHQHHLLIPGMSFPMTREILEGYADTPEPPDVPAGVLRKFALSELTPQERAELNLDAKDPNSINRLRIEYDRAREAAIGVIDLRPRGVDNTVAPLLLGERATP